MMPGFCVVGQDGYAEFRLFPARDSAHYPLVTFWATSPHAAVLMGRLYYQHELLEQCIHALDREDKQIYTSNPAALVLAAYRRFGRRGLERLEGDYALVLWDAQEGRLIAARDPLGGYPLFWARSPGGVALSTSFRPLLERLQRRSLDLEYVAEFLTMLGPVNERNSERCAYEGIHRLAAGTMLSVRPADGHVEHFPYWDWRQQIEAPVTHRPEELGERYLHLLRAAVRERIQGRIASHVSGGMDSTTVTLLARDLINAGAGEVPLHALSLVYHRLTDLARETPYLESAWQQGGMVIHPIPADDLLDFDSFTDPPPHDEPFAGLWRWAMDHAMVDAAAQLGATTMLTGIGADEMLDMQPFHIAELLRTWRVRLAWKEACRWAWMDHCSPWDIFYPFGIAIVFRRWVAVARQFSWLRPPPASVDHWNPELVAPWIVPGFARRYAMRSQAVEEIRRTYEVFRSARLSFALFSIASRTGDVGRWSLAAPQGMAIAHPFLDLRVLRMGLGVQLKSRPHPDRLKPLLAEATRGLLPDVIRNRRRKGHFNEVYYLGLSRNLPFLEAMIRKAPIDDLGVFDKDILLNHLRQAALGGTAFRPSHRLNLALSFIRWWTLQDQWWRDRSLPSEIVRLGPRRCILQQCSS